MYEGTVLFGMRFFQNPTSSPDAVKNCETASPSCLGFPKSTFSAYYHTGQWKCISNTPRKQQTCSYTKMMLLMNCNVLYRHVIVLLRQKNRQQYGVGQNRLSRAHPTFLDYFYKIPNAKQMLWHNHNHQNRGHRCRGSGPWCDEVGTPPL
jgi:hypothetical protein